ncbi:DNA-directed RNA polymerase II subunit RPB9 [Camelus dromedarius]|uniref:DNA-directed RNA polymerase II subunit RPB9 n=1 Tax=Camelus dromedarius TaxID=9838 RepID=A0A5N4DPZ8_CAMDR|nr:DNA-directed RNA polymerase II subunit RPB9 [Camelus dromedarius]
MLLARLCNNMLYPKEDRRTAFYSTRELTKSSLTCPRTPRLPRTEDQPCQKCGHKEACSSSHKCPGRGRHALVLVCTAPHCGHRWTE